MGKRLCFAMILGMSFLLASCITPMPVAVEATATQAEPVPSATPPAPTAAATQTTQTPASSATPESTWIRAVPDSGVPGQVIQIEGYLPGGYNPEELAAQDYLTHAEICWGGCMNGLTESVEVSWSRTESGRFSLPFTVPPIPWLANDGPHLMEAGDYTLDLIQLTPVIFDCDNPNGCAVTPQASTTFHLTKSAPHPDCDGQTCGSLTASPASAAPGKRIEVTGWAPLLKIIDLPFGYDLALVTGEGELSYQNMLTFPVEQAMDGSISGSFLMPQSGSDGQPLAPGTYRLALHAGGLGVGKGSPPVLINLTSIQVGSSLNWTQVKHPVPLWITPGADRNGEYLAADPLHPSRMAYCASGSIRISEDASQSWSAVSTDAVSQLPPDKLVVLGDQPPTCTSVLLDSAHPDSLYAVFTVVHIEYGAPPFYYAGYFTSDRGKTWQLVPVPSITVIENTVTGGFGGFWASGSAVQALYYGSSSQQGLPLAKQTTDDGRTWIDSTLACPDVGPCLRWDAAPTQGGGMGAEMPQSVLASFDGGQTWQDTRQTVELRMPGPHQIAALTETQAVLLAGTEGYPLRYTTDAGQTWQVLVLPPLPIAVYAWPGGYPGLQMLPDGSLMSMATDTGQWYRLAPSAQTWCRTSLVSPEMNPVLLQVAGGRVWWLSPADRQAKSAPAGSLRCVQ